MAGALTGSSQGLGVLVGQGLGRALGCAHAALVGGAGRNKEQVGAHAVDLAVDGGLGARPTPIKAITAATPMMMPSMVRDAAHLVGRQTA